MDMTWEIDFLDRVKFGADFAVRLTGLLKEYGAKKYIESHAPWIAEALAGSELADVVAEVTRKGIYINVRLTGFHPSPTSHAVVSFRFLGRLMQGPVVRATDRRHSLRLDVLTMTRSAYVQVRRAVVAR
jgi:hypothetical protein